jgi:hypothetical protein
MSQSFLLICIPHPFQSVCKYSTAKGVGPLDSTKDTDKPVLDCPKIINDLSGSGHPVSAGRALSNRRSAPRGRR